MKKSVILILFFATFFKSAAQPNLTYQTKLYYLCKVWGYMKYFHSEVSTCKVNWDSTLLANVPLIKSNTSDSAYYWIIENMMNSAGPMALPTTAPPVIPNGYDKNLNLNWFNSPHLSGSINTILYLIKSRFRPHTNCFVAQGYSSWLLLDDSVATVTNPNYPDEAGRLLVAFRYWNIINYFNPNNDIMDQPWDSTLMQFILRFSNSSNQLDYNLTFMEFVAKINDTHASGSGTSYVYNNYYGYYYPNFKIEFIGGNTVVTNIYGTSPLQIGDVISKIDGITTDSLRMNFAKYISASNPAALNRDLNKRILSGQYGTVMVVETQTTSGTQTFNISRNIYSSTYYSSVNDLSKKNPLVKVIQPQNIGYINMANVTGESVLDGIYDDSLRSKPAIIFDFRNYPKISVPYSNFFRNITDYNHLFVQLTEPSVLFPGVLYDIYQGTFGYTSPSKTYYGKVYVLVSEETQSAAEYSTMALQTMPTCLVVGSQTAGADGNVTRMVLPGGFNTYFSTLKVLYPDGYCAQRNGIRIDLPVVRTVNGVRNGVDEILQRAIQNFTAVNEISSFKNPISVYPNPSQNIFTISSNENADESVGIFIADVFGKIVLQQENKFDNNGHIKINSDQLKYGIYFLRVETVNGTFSQKIIKTL